MRVSNMYTFTHTTYYEFSKNVSVKVIYHPRHDPP